MHGSEQREAPPSLPLLLPLPLPLLLPLPLSLPLPTHPRTPHPPPNTRTYTLSSPCVACMVLAGVLPSPFLVPPLLLLLLLLLAAAVWRN